MALKEYRSGEVHAVFNGGYAVLPAFLAIASALAFPMSAPAQNVRPAPLPLQIETDVKETLTILASPLLTRSISVSESQRAHEQYNLSLTHVGEEMTVEMAAVLLRSRPRAVEEEIARIAWDRRQNPKRYQDVIDAVVFRNFNGPVQPHSLRSHPPRNYCTEEYRLAWEYLLLMPEPQQPTLMYRYAAVDALREIGNPDSVQIGIALFKLTLQGSDPVLGDRQTFRDLALMLIKSFPGMESVRGMAECATAARHVSNPRTISSGLSADLTQSIHRLFEPINMSVRTTRQWTEALINVRQEPLEQKEREIVDLIQEALSMSSPYSSGLRH